MCYNIILAPQCIELLVNCISMRFGCPKSIGFIVRRLDMSCFVKIMVHGTLMFASCIEGTLLISLALYFTFLIALCCKYLRFKTLKSIY